MFSNPLRTMYAWPATGLPASEPFASQRPSQNAGFEVTVVSS